MNAGKLRDRIVVQQQTTTKDEYGQPLHVWQDVLTVWAEVTSATGREVFAASGFSAQTSHTARVRWSPQVVELVTTSMRVLHRGRAYNVTGISDVEGTREVLTLALLQIGGGQP